MPDLSMASSSKILEFAKLINDKYFKLCLDTGHSAIMKDSPAEDVRILGKEYLETLHIHDNNGKYDIHAHPFSGVINWEDFGRALYEIRYDGVINLEVHEAKHVPKELVEAEELLLYRKVEYLAKLASGEK